MAEDEPSAISVAMTRLGLQPGVAFEAKVAQLAQLVAAHKTVSLLRFTMSMESRNPRKSFLEALPIFGTYRVKFCLSDSRLRDFVHEEHYTEHLIH